MRRSLSVGLFSTICAEEPARARTMRNTEIAAYAGNPHEDAGRMDRDRADLVRTVEEVLESDVRPPSGLERLARRRDVRALAVVRVDRSGLDVRERVSLTPSYSSVGWSCTARLSPSARMKLSSSAGIVSRGSSASMPAMSVPCSTS